MSFTLLPGQRSWSLDVDEEGHRTYTVVNRVRTEDPRDGPALASLTPGLPVPGSPWLMDNDVDLWAWCRPGGTVVPVLVNEPNRHFDITQKFSTQPPDTDHDPSQSPEDPLLQPAKVSGGFTKGKVEATHSFNGVPILTSSYERVRGPQVEFDSNSPTVKIEQNVAVLNLPLLCLLVDTVNNLPMWGLSPRKIKLSSVSWERKFNGMGGLYYSRSLEFEINLRTHDRVLLDEGSKCLNGKWDAATGNWTLVDIGGGAPNPYNPAHYQQFVDRKGNAIRCVLNGTGLPSSVMVGNSVAAVPYAVGDMVTYGGAYYIAIVGNINANPASSTAKWVQQLSGLGVEAAIPFDTGASYSRGDLVLLEYADPGTGATISEYHLCNTNTGPSIWPMSPSWTWLPDGVNVQGAWQGTVSGAATGNAGFVYVTYYPGSNLFLLGIPTTF